MIGVVWRSCAWSSLHNNNNNTNTAQSVAVHSCGGGDDEEQRLVLTHNTTNPDFPSHNITNTHITTK